jgi:hypothetical protein
MKVFLSYSGDPVQKLLDQTHFRLSIFHDKVHIKLSMQTQTHSDREHL